MISTGRRDRLASLCLSLTLIVLAACASPSDSGLSDGSPTSTGPALAVGGCSLPPKGTGPAGLQEGEIFGSIYLDGVRACEADLAPFDNLNISLEILSVPSPGVSLTPYNPVLSLSPSFPLMWEFWDVLASDGPCQGSRAAETPHADGGMEAHCVRAGAYRFTGPGRGGTTRQFDVDYMQVPSSGILDLTPGALTSQVQVARTDSELDGFGTQVIDLAINTDLGVSVYSEIPVLDIDATTSPDTTAFEDQASPVGTSQSWFRFNVLRSTTTWNSLTHDDAMGSRGRYMARLYSRAQGSSNWSPLTRYYLPLSEGAFIRKAQFSAPTCPTVYEVGVELLRPDENPENAPNPASVRTITVNCEAPSPPLPAPSGLAASGITTSGATITWVNGTTQSGTTTTLQYRTNGTTSWVTVPSTIAAGTTSHNLDNLGADTWYDVQIRHTLGGTSSTWTTQSNLFKTTAITVLPPSNVVASNVTSSSATINWTNGTTASGTTTRLEYRPAGGTWAVASTTIGEGVTSFPLSDLVASTAYEARVNHTLSGVTSAWAAGSFATSSAPNLTITSFYRSDCTNWFSSAKWRTVHDFAWSVSGSPGTTTWEIRESASSDPSTGSVILTGSGNMSASTNEYILFTPPGPQFRNFWIRYLTPTPTPWFPLADNTVEVTACAF